MRICVATVVSGPWRGWVPLWLLSLLRAYPDYEARVFVQGGIPEEVAEALLPLQGLGTFDIAVDAFQGYDPTIPRLAAGLRYLIFTKDRTARYWSSYDAVYITDGDLLIAREAPPLHEQHERHCKAVGLPYSNMIRPHLWKMLTGLHYAKREYMAAVAEASDWYDKRFKHAGWSLLDAPAPIKDERLLYEITRMAGLKFPRPHNTRKDPEGRRAWTPAACDEEWFRPWHGVNVGYFVDEKHWHRRLWEVNRHPIWREYRAWCERLAGDPLFPDCFAVVPERGQLAFERIVEWEEA